MVVNVSLQREASDDDVEEIGKVVAPRYPGEKSEGWWLVVGDTNSNTLYSIKRVTCGLNAKVINITRVYSHCLLILDAGKIGICCAIRPWRLQFDFILYV